MHTKEVKIDLRVSRRESGLLQSDLAHLLGTTQPRVSRLEQGKAILTNEEAVKLGVIFGKPTNTLFRLLSARVRDELDQQLSKMSDDTVDAPDAEARQKTLNRLSVELLASNNAKYDEK